MCIRDSSTSKWTSAVAEINEFTAAPQLLEDDDEFLVARTRRAEAVLAALPADSATGPDHLP
eukprot:12636229-Alexandrium_andersonii.AAC.1